MIDSEQFTLEQQSLIAAWLEAKEKAGYTLSELIDEFTGRTANLLSE